ncbi:DUF488 family protein [Actinomycetaceae bacterium WB03_NA08]|uniref:DUF488 family protein n=1 Tax=Scrofimicrobium canadense TaxID=2652290 RepID=A0A6N7VQL7_9ACTO|nr:DUF488 family protein [Scrofimicrobium canadense]MSS84027.1 DUF488 family protein [Scrofimicrobium canadense]
MSSTYPVFLKRIYDTPSTTDGARVLVDRLWPRGVSKEQASLTVWSKNVAPSAQLRTWYGHDPDKFTEFEEKYRKELKNPMQHQALSELLSLHEAGPLTVLTASKAIDISDAAVIRKILEEGTLS